MKRFFYKPVLKIKLPMHLMILIIAICTGILFYSIIGWTLDKEKHSPAERMQKVAIQRFGVDGAALEFVEKVAELGDGWSGVNGVRWDFIETQPPKDDKHFYFWTKSDRFVNNFQKTGRKLQVTIRIFNDWAIERTTQKKVIDPATGKKVGACVRIKPKHLSDWAEFIAAFVERYDADGHADMPGLRYPITHIQIESEPENVWADVDGYVEALCIAYRAAKKVNPDVQIMAAGFNMFDFFSLGHQKQQELLRNPFVQHKINFIKGFFAKAGACFDILSVHLERGYESIAPSLDWYQQQMKTNSFKKPIWSEDTCSGPYLAPMTFGAWGSLKLKLLQENDAETVKWFRQEQAQLLVKKAVVSFAYGVEKVFISSDVDWPTYHLPMWRYMGLLDDKGNRKPAFYSFNTMVSKLDGFTNVKSLTISSGVFAYCFTKPYGKVDVLWSEGEEIINLPVSSKNISVTGISGNKSKPSPLRLHITSSPIFVEEE